MPFEDAISLGGTAPSGTGTSVTLEDIVASGDRTLVAFFVHRDAGDDEIAHEVKEITDTMGLVWTLEFHSSGQALTRFGAAMARTPPGGASGDLTITFDRLGGKRMLAVVEIDEADDASGGIAGIGPIEAHEAFGNTNEQRVWMQELADPANGQLVMWMVGRNDPDIVFDDLTERIHYQTSATGTSFAVGWRAGDYDHEVVASWGGVAASNGGVGIEIRKALSAARPPARRVSLTEGSAKSGSATRATTETFRPPPNSQIFVTVKAERIAGSGPQEPVVTGPLLSFGLVDDMGFDTIAAPTQKLWLFAGTTPRVSADTELTIVFPAAHTNIEWQVLAIRNAEGGTPGVEQSVAVATDSATTLAPGLAAFQSLENATLIVAATADTDDLAPGDGLAYGFSRDGSGLDTVWYGWRESPGTSPTVAWDTLQPAAAIAVEVRSIACVPNTDPKVTHDFSGTQVAAEWELFDKSNGRLVASKPRSMTAETEWAIPVPLKEETPYLAVVRVWDDAERAATPDAPAYKEASTTFGICPELPSGIYDLTAVSQGSPIVTLTWKWAGTTPPETFTITVDGLPVEENIDPDDLLTDAGEYELRYWHARPDMEHTYSVSARVTEDGRDKGTPGQKQTAPSLKPFNAEWVGD